MKYFRAIGILLTFLLLGQNGPAYAAPRLSEEELALRISSRIIEAAEIEGKLFEAQLVRPDEKAWLTMKTREVTKSVLSDMFLRVAPGEVTEETVVEVVKKIPSEIIAEFVRNSVRPILTYTRLKGVAVGLALGASLALEVVIPVILTKLNHPELIPISAIIPYHLFALSGGLSIQKKLIHERLAQLHGGKANLKAFLENIKYARSNLIDEGASGASLFVAGENGSALYQYEKSSWFKTLIRKLGWRDDKLTYSSLDKYCEKRGMFNYFRKNLKNSTKTELEKTWTLLQAIYKTQDKSVLLDLNIRYKKSLSPIAEIGNINEILPGVLEWAQKVLESKDAATLFENAKNLPEKSTPYLISLVWENEIMPELASRNEIPFGQMRRLSKAFLEIQAKFKPLETFQNSALKVAWVKYLTAGSVTAVCDDALVSRQITP